MKILIVIAKSPYYSLLVTLHTEKLRREVKSLVAQRKNSAAMATALLKGRFERQVDRYEIPDVKADVLLSENSVNWDLTSRDK
jgi:hypothetical protein